MVDIIIRMFKKEPLGSSEEDRLTASTIKVHGEGLVSAFDRIVRSDLIHEGTIVESFTQAAAVQKNRDFTTLAEKASLRAQYIFAADGEKGLKSMRDALFQKQKAFPKEDTKTDAAQGQNMKKPRGRF